MRKQADIEVRKKYSDVSNPFYVDVTIVQHESDGAFAPGLKLKKSDNIDCCEDLEGKFVSKFVSRNIFRKGTSRKLRVHAKARTQEISQRIYTVCISICNGYKWIFLRYSHSIFEKDSIG